MSECKYTLTVDEVGETCTKTADNSATIQSNVIPLIGKADVNEATYVKKEYKLLADDQAFFPTRAEDAPEWLNTLVDSVTQSALTDANANLIAATTNLNEVISELNIAKNIYTNTILTSDDIDQRILSAISTLNSSLQTSDANILTIAQTAATPDEARAIADQAISVSVASTDTPTTLGSVINTLQEATADGDEANATSIDTLTSSIIGLDGEIDASASAITYLNTTVGITGTSPSGSGILADLEILQKQNDGVIETITDTYEVILNPSTPATAELVRTAEPYATWIAEDTASGTQDSRHAHVGDVYIRYQSTPNGAREYVASFKFIKTAVDGSSPFSTDTEGFTWAIVTDQAAQDAYQQALNAYDLADSKRISYYRATIADMNAIPVTASNNEDMCVVHNNTPSSGNGTYIFQWNGGVGSLWTKSVDGVLTATASEVTAISAYLEGSDGTYGGESLLSNTLQTTEENVEAKFEYGSILKLRGVSYTSGFGMVATATGGDGTEASPFSSEFFINAESFKFTNSNRTGQASPFIIDAAGATPKVTFNGIVNFTNTNIDSGFPGTTAINGGLIETNTINAEKINTVGLIAENISAEVISGKTINGGTINGARINGAVIKASFLDLDGELEVLTNYYLVVGSDISGIPQEAQDEGRFLINYVYSPSHDSVLVEATGNYRIPSFSTVTDTTTSLNVTPTQTLANTIFSYDNYTSGTNSKSVTRRPHLIRAGDVRLVTHTFVASSQDTAGNPFSVDVDIAGDTFTLSITDSNVGYQSSTDDSNTSGSVSTGSLRLNGNIILSEATDSASVNKDFEFPSLTASSTGTFVRSGITFTATLSAVDTTITIAIGIQNSAAGETVTRNFEGTSSLITLTCNSLFHVATRPDLYEGLSTMSFSTSSALRLRNL